MASKDLSTMDFDDDTLRLVYKYSAQGLSAREIGEQTGLEPMQVLAARRQVLDNVDPLTITEWRTKLLLDLQKLSDDAMDAFDNVEDKAKAPMLVAATGAMKAVLGELRRSEDKGTADVERLNILRQREIVSVYEQGHLPFIQWLVDEKGLDRDELERQSQLYILEAGRRMDERNQPSGSST